MYQVIDLCGFSKGDMWEVRKNGKVEFRGSFKTTLRYTIGELGFDLVDFERAVSSIINNGHNTLNFDRSKTLVSTSYQDVQNQRKLG